MLENLFAFLQNTEISVYKKTKYHIYSNINSLKPLQFTRQILGKYKKLWHPKANFDGIWPPLFHKKCAGTFIGELGICDPEGQIFLSTSNSHDSFFFMHTLPVSIVFDHFGN